MEKGVTTPTGVERKGGRKQRMKRKSGTKKERCSAKWDTNERNEKELKRDGT